MAAATPPGRLLVAVSGGPDSTALLLALVEAGREVVVAHFDHALRPESHREARAVEALARRLGVELVTGRREGALARGSLQAAARAARYRFFDGARASAGADWVVLAHTADDVVEGMLLHLLRGSGLAGLRGMPERREVYVRPLLDVWRRDIDAYLLEKNVTPLDDPSNRDRRFARVRVRLDLLPALERVRPGLTRRLHGVARDYGRRQERLAHAARHLAEGADVGRLAAAEPALRREALRQMYRRAGGTLPGLSRRQLAGMEKLLGSSEARRLDLPGGIRFNVEAGRVEMQTRDGRGKPSPHEITVRECRGCADPRAVHLRPGLALSVGFRRPGLRIRPLGSRGSRKLQDILVDAKIPRSERDAFPLLFADGKLAWVPGLAISAEFAAVPGGRSEHVMLESGHRPSQGVSL